MKIELSSPTLLKITWPLYPSEIDQEIRKRLSTVPGIEAGRGRVAWAPVIQLARLMELYPKASFEYEAICAADDIAAAFAWLLAHNGAQFSLDLFGVVQVTGEHVSPLLQELVKDRSHALRRFVTEYVPVPRAQRPEQPSIAHLYPKPKRRRAKKEKAK